MILIAIIRLPLNILTECLKYVVSIDKQNKGYWKLVVKRTFKRIK